MSAEEWPRLVQQVERLIAELKQSRAEAARWHLRATELERLNLPEQHHMKIEEQAKERELERLRREHKKAVSGVQKVLADLDRMQQLISDKEEPADG